MQQAGYTPQQIRDAIAAIESSGEKDPYRALGKEVNRQGDRALGRYQVMASNLPQWSKQALGREYTVDEFLADPAAQDKLFDTIFGADVEKYGHRGAASKWFTGSPNEPNTTDIHGKLTGKTYADTFMEQLGRASARRSPPPPMPLKAPTTIDTAVSSRRRAGRQAEEEERWPCQGADGQPVRDVGRRLPDQPRRPGCACRAGTGRADLDGNPQQVEQRRAALAAIMQRLDSGITGMTFPAPTANPESSA